MSNSNGIQKIHLAIAILLALEAEAHGRFGHYEDVAGKNWVRNKFSTFEFFQFNVASDIKLGIEI